jgi:hypothetical protein
MSLRTRLLLAFAAVVLIPIALLAFGLRQEMTRRLSQEYQLRVERVVQTIREDLARESTGIAERLASLETALQNDNRFRLAAVAGVESEREYLLDYAGTAMRLTGLSMLQITGSTSTPCGSLLCATGCPISPGSWITCFGRLRRTWACGQKRLPRRPSRCLPRTTGGGTTSVSSAIAWNG